MYASSFKKVKSFQNSADEEENPPSEFKVSENTEEKNAPAGTSHNFFDCKADSKEDAEVTLQESTAN